MAWLYIVLGFVVAVVFSVLIVVQKRRRAIIKHQTAMEQVHKEERQQQLPEQKKEPSKIICEYCRAKNKSDSEKCSKCGAELE